MEQPKTTKNVGQPCVICGQAADAQATIAALQARVRELESDPYKQGFADALEKVASDWASKEFRGHDEIQGVEVQAFLDTRHVHYEECRGVKPLQFQLTQRTAELEAAKANRVPNSMQHVIELQAELERVRGELAEERAMMLLTNEVLIPSLQHRQGMEG